MYVTLSLPPPPPPPFPLLHLLPSLSYTFLSFFFLFLYTSSTSPHPPDLSGTLEHHAPLCQCNEGQIPALSQRASRPDWLRGGVLLHQTQHQGESGQCGVRGEEGNRVGILMERAYNQLETFKVQRRASLEFSLHNGLCLVSNVGFGAVAASD